MRPVLGRESTARQNYTAALERLEVLATGERPVPLAGVGDEILALAVLLQAQPRLRRALSDPSRTAEDRADLLGSLIEGKVAEDTATLVRIMVAGRWSSGADLLDATERLGVEALLASAESAGDLAEVEDELFRFGQMVRADFELSAALGASTAPLGPRVELAHALLAGRARPATLRLVDVALRGLGGRNFTASLARLVELAAERRDRQIAFVSVAVPLTDAEERRLGGRLSRMYGRQVEVKVTIDPLVLGGVSVRVGHDLYDATVARRLTQSRAELARR